MKIRILGIAFVLVALTFQSCGQQGPGSVYDIINIAYLNKDYPMLLSAYEDEAFYLSPGGRIETNKELFLQPIKEMFEKAEQEGITLTMNFRVVKREYYNDAALDVGYYKLDKIGQNNAGILSSEVGKFIAISKKQSDGSWKFRAEGFSDAPLEAFLGR